MSTSQPLAALPSQSAKPALQVYAQRPAAHSTALLARAAHAVPQAPQLRASVSVLVSQPLVGSRSQSEKVPVHAPTAHEPFMQAGVALVTAHRASQRPQWATFDCGSTHAPPQQLWPVGHACVASQPGTQTLPTQRLPGPHWSAVTHSTQARVAVSQWRGATPASPVTETMQSSSARQPRTQLCDAGSQYVPRAQRSAVGTQATQRRVDTSHAGVIGVEAQSVSLEQPLIASAASLASEASAASLASEASVTSVTSLTSVTSATSGVFEASVTSAARSSKLASGAASTRPPTTAVPVSEHAASEAASAARSAHRALKR